MARSSSKKPGEPKCRATSAPVEGRDWVRIGGHKYLREAAEQKGKFIPLEYRKTEGGQVPARKTKAEKEAEKAGKAAPPPPEPAAAPPEEAAPAEAEATESFLDEAPEQDEPTE